ncbi:glyoxalase/bleomycin resistance protein/dioxygenase [Halorubrum aidingense JCM 13560]|uniref:Glyoxalase/bleomycin resistance protein/dioxygenase n=1 Tax=Halorubrum aidingense JCM 13560 TaxID=1230454 RepID=M0PJ26_9EURY|nr:VOC family protein [Halorubrum aidingense]EMA68765.1 glyoxalase/bleomycin resistance protein/dioxygenase [Halorubrum aidingense JCM 13560]
MLSDTPGLHHVTGIVGDAAAHAAFYGEVLGLRLLRRTVNYEDVLQYHLYFGDATGSPGSVFTVFPDPTADPGRPGKPGYEAVAFAVPTGSLDYWRGRLAERGIEPEPVERFGDRLLRLADPSGTRVELVERPPDPENDDPWLGNAADAVPKSAAIRGLDGVTALPADPYGTASVLDTLGFAYEAETDDRIRYRAPGDRATVVDILDRDAAYLREGPGTLHHAAVRVADREALLDWHELFRDRGYDVSRVKDRHFFHSLYVRGPGGLLVELATEATTPDGPDAAIGPRGPGLAPPDVDGHATELYLPPRFEDDRELIEDQLPAFRIGDESVDRGDGR